MHSPFFLVPFLSLFHPGWYLVTLLEQLNCAMSVKPQTFFWPRCPNPGSASVVTNWTSCGVIGFTSPKWKEYGVIASDEGWGMRWSINFSSGGRVPTFNWWVVGVPTFLQGVGMVLLPSRWRKGSVTEIRRHHSGLAGLYTWYRTAGPTIYYITWLACAFLNVLAIVNWILREKK